MGNIRKIAPVKLFVGVLSTDEAIRREVTDRLVGKFGPVDVVSELMDFTFTDYYTPEMGAGIRRSFFAFAELIDPAELPDIKIFTNELEEEYALLRDDSLNRRINLDPGYVEMPKMVLASTKNFRHRIYLRDGIYAEVTLYWSKGGFHFYEAHTFPDYRTFEYREYFRKVRERYVEQLREGEKGFSG